MPHENDGKNGAEVPDEQPLSNTPGLPSRVDHPVTKEVDDDPRQSNSEASRIERDIRTGEVCLIILQSLTLLVGIIVALIYYAQLQQMTDATRAAAKSTRIAADALETSQSQFDRSMAQIISQTSAEIHASAAAERSANIASTELRPWIKIESVIPTPVKGWPPLAFHSPFDGKLKSNLAYFQIQVSIRNIGHSPASTVEIHPSIFFNYLQDGMTTYADTVRTEQDRWCKGSIQQKTNLLDAITLFPSDSFSQNIGLTVPIPRNAVVHEKGSRETYTSAVIVVCANYSGTSSRYQTEGRWAVLDVGGKGNLLQLGTDLSPPRLRFDHEAVADRAH